MATIMSHAAQRAELPSPSPISRSMMVIERNNMTSVGETLRSERLKRNLSLDQISRELKISGRFLEAIETEHFERLPGGLFAKSFVRQYARLLELDDEDLA